MAIDWGRMARGVGTGYLSAKIANTEANDKLNNDILKAAGLEYHTNTLPKFKTTETSRASEYKQIAVLLGSEEGADYFDANDFILGDGKSVERVQSFLKNKKIKTDAFKDYLPTTNYADRYNTRVTSIEERGAQIHKDLGMRQGGIGPSVIEGLVTNPMDQESTITKEITTAGPSEQIEGTPIVTSPMETKTVTEPVPRTTELSDVSTFFTPKVSVLNLGKASEIAASASTYRGFGEGIKKDQFGVVTVKFAGNKDIEYNAFRNVMDDLSSTYETKDGKVNLSMVSEAANTQLYKQTQGTVGKWTTGAVTKGRDTKTGGEIYTAPGFNEEFNSLYSTDKEKKMAFVQHMFSLGNKSEQQYFAVSFPNNLTFSDGTNIREFLITVTR